MVAGRCGGDGSGKELPIAMNVSWSEGNLHVMISSGCPQNMRGEGGVVVGACRECSKRVPTKFN